MPEVRLIQSLNGLSYRRWDDWRQQNPRLESGNWGFSFPALEIINIVLTQIQEELGERSAIQNVTCLVIYFRTCRQKQNKIVFIFISLVKNQINWRLRGIRRVLAIDCPFGTASITGTRVFCLQYVSTSVHSCFSKVYKSCILNSFYCN